MHLPVNTTRLLSTGDEIILRTFPMSCELLSRVTYVLAVFEDLLASLRHERVEFLPAFAAIARTVDTTCCGLNEYDLVALTAPHDVSKRFVNLESLERHFIIICRMYLVATAA